jgi:hypothetical protein
MAQVVVWLATEAPDYMTAARLNVTGGLDKDLRPQGREVSQREKANPLHQHAFYFCAIGPTLFRIPQGGVK